MYAEAQTQTSRPQTPAPVLGAVQFVATVSAGGVITLSRSGTFSPDSGQHVQPLVLTAPVEQPELPHPQEPVSLYGAMETLRQRSARLTTFEISVPATIPDGKNATQWYISGEVGQVRRLNAENVTVYDRWRMPHPSWGKRFGPMLDDADEGYAVSTRMTSNLFTNMTCADWEVFATHFVNEPIVSHVRWTRHGIEAGALLSAQAYIALSLRALGSEEDAAKLIAAYPLAGGELQALNDPDIINNKTLGRVLRGIGSRHEERFIGTGSAEYMAGVNLVHNWFVLNFGVPKHAYRHTNVKAIVRHFKEAVDVIILECDIKTVPAARVAGQACAMYVAGSMKYVTEQQLHGDKRNERVAFVANVLFNVGVAVGDAFSAGLATQVTASIKATTTLINETKKSLIRRATDRVLEVHDWRSNVGAARDELIRVIDDAANASGSGEIVKLAKAFKEAFSNTAERVTNRQASADPSTNSMASPVIHTRGGRALGVVVRLFNWPKHSRRRSAHR